ncbi:hypothetical protein L1987_78788 [Smallanthus sonchifolius]|uniref:Uncharacterized protein n=1 Tax=Smallanthus sonchifolius TaxID=185202 RepID=A0ACB8ZDW0_9ASTR|nr:hypothetical protein L1987_78788 [Smallanthus sonchifolius]
MSLSSLTHIPPKTDNTSTSGTVSSPIHSVNQEGKTSLPTIAPIITFRSDEESSFNSDEETASFDDLASTEAFEHLFMTVRATTERVDQDSDIEDAASRTTAPTKTIFQNTYQKQQFTFDDIPPSKWPVNEGREKDKVCSAKLGNVHVG